MVPNAYLLLVNNMVITILQHKALGLGLQAIWYIGTLRADRAPV
jgi:hypothetical protein